MEGAVDVAGLGVSVVVAGDVADAGFFGEGAEGLALAVVEDVDVELVGGPVDVHGGERGIANDAEGLVVGGDEEIDVGPVFLEPGEGHGRTLERPNGLHEAEEEDGEGVGLSAEQDDDAGGVDPVPLVAGVLEERDDGADAPPGVADGGKPGEHHEGDGDHLGL